MKILFITDLYPIMHEEKKTPKTLLNFVTEWQNQGHEVDIIKPNFLLNSFLRGKPFYKTGLYGNVYNINFLTPFWNVKPVNTNYDLVFAHMPSGILFADKLGLPFCAGIHNSDLEVLTSLLYKFHFRKRMYKALCNAKAIACRSYVIEKKIIKLFPEFARKTFSAPSGVAENIIFYPQPFNSSRIKVITCANLKKRKNIDKLIYACKNLENFELTVIGDGTERKKLEKIDKNVKFTGWLEPDEVYSKMRDSDIFVLPSIGETFGMVYLEAMASGCITVCTKNDGIDGIIKDGQNGFLTLPISSEIRKILLNIKDLDDDKRKLLQYNAFNTIKELTVKQCAHNYLQHLLKIL